MKQKDIHFRDEKVYSDGAYSFCKQCLLDKLDKNYPKLVKMYQKATDTNELAQMILDDDALIGTTLRAAIERVYGNPWKYIRGMLGEKCRKTGSDAGGLKIGNGGMSIIVPNGRGDGVTRYAILEKDEYYGYPLMDFFTSVKGKIDIYSYDCGDTVAETIEGWFGIYVYDGLIAFERWD